jgi:hypothetical protein
MLRLFQNRGRAGAGLKHDDPEAPRDERVDERGRFRRTGHFAHGRHAHGRAAQPPHHVGNFAAHPRFEQRDPRPVQTGHAGFLVPLPVLCPPLPEAR